MSQQPTTPAYRLEPIPGAGLGMIATRAIPRGTLIVSEAPLFTLRGNFLEPDKLVTTIESKLQTLSDDQRQVFFSLHNSYAMEFPGAYGILKTNAHPLGVNAQDYGIFPQCSRFNHSCASNANYSYNVAAGQETTYAVKDIAPEDQITVTYLSEAHFNQTRNNRWQILMRGFRFECRCSRCGASPEEVAASDRRRVEIARLDAIIGDGVTSITDPAKCLGCCRMVLQLYKEEGVGDLMLYRTYLDALQVCILHGDKARTSAFASLAVDLKKICQGENATNLDEAKPYIEHPESHKYSGTSRIWATRTQSTRAAGTVGFEEWLWSRAR